MTLTKNGRDFDFDLPILGQEKYLKTKSDDFGWLYDEKCVIAFFIDKKAIFRRMVFSTNVISNDKISKKTEKDFLNDLIHYIKSNKLCDFIYKAQSNVVFSVCPSNVDCVPWGTYEVNLERSEEQLFASFNYKCRNVIRNAIKNGVIVEKSENVHDIYENIKSTMMRQKSIHYPSYDYLNHLNNLENGSILFVVKKDNVIQGSLVLLYDDYKGYAMYAGSIQRPQTGSLDLLHFEAMKFLQTKNIKKYDFVGTRLNIQKGSKQEGIDRFKRKFNPELIEGYAFRVIVRPFKYFLFFVMSSIYFKLKGIQYTDPILTIQAEELKRNF